MHLWLGENLFWLGLSDESSEEPPVTTGARSNAAIAVAASAGAVPDPRQVDAEFCGCR